jgi:hypothetical protein
MTKSLILALTMAAMGAAFAVLPTQDQKQPKLHEQHDKSTYPVADYEETEPSDLNLRRLRKARAKRRNVTLRAGDSVDVREIMITERSRSSWGGPPSHAPVEAGLPASQSAAIVVGEVTDAQAFLSEDKVSVYSEFTVRVVEVLKNNTGVPLTLGSAITTVRRGGAVRFSSGEVIQKGTGGKPFPLKNRKYVLFLRYESEGEDFPIITAYELRGGIVLPLDGLDIDGRLLEPYAAYQEFKGMDEVRFLTKVREALASPSDGGPKP